MNRRQLLTSGAAAIAASWDRGLKSGDVVVFPTPTNTMAELILPIHFGGYAQQTQPSLWRSPSGRVYFEAGYWPANSPWPPLGSSS